MNFNFITKRNPFGFAVFTLTVASVTFIMSRRKHPSNSKPLKKRSLKGDSESVPYEEAKFLISNIPPISVSHFHKYISHFRDPMLLFFSASCFLTARSIMIHNLWPVICRELESYLYSLDPNTAREFVTARSIRIIFEWLYFKMNPPYTSIKKLFITFAAALSSYGVFELINSGFSTHSFLFSEKPTIGQLIIADSIPNESENNLYLVSWEFNKRKIWVENAVSFFSVICAIKDLELINNPDRRLFIFILLYLGSGHLVKRIIFGIILHPSTALSRSLVVTRLNLENNMKLVVEIRAALKESKSFQYIESRECDPAQFICPVSYGIMLDPVTAPDGKVYDRQSLQAWYDSGGRTCPLIPSFALTDPKNIESYIQLRNSIRGYLKINDISILPREESTKLAVGYGTCYSRL